jgi:DNA polymerase-3 subunit delta'
VSAPFEEQRKKKRPDTALTKEEEDYLTPRALKLLEQSMRRELSARERSAMIEVIRCAESVLRDVLAICSDSAAPLVNTDVADAVRRIARDATVRSATLGLAACRRAVASLERNVTPQLALEVMLLSIKEAR